jgi:hypothetical protein
MESDNSPVRVKRAIRYFASSFIIIETWSLASDTPVSSKILLIQLATSAIYALCVMGIMLCLRYYFDYKKQQQQLTVKKRDEDLIRLKKEQDDVRREEAKRKEQLKAQYGNLDAEEIVFNNEINAIDKRLLLTEVHRFSSDETEALLKTAESEIHRTKIKEVIGKIIKKADEVYGNIPSDDEQNPVPENVKMLVWQRDAGKCVKCGSQYNLIFNHIIPASKGGSSAEINIRLLCAKCKYDGLI